MSDLVKPGDVLEFGELDSADGMPLGAQPRHAVVRVSALRAAVQRPGAGS
jgi:hypothetical protein